MKDAINVGYDTNSDGVVEEPKAADVATFKANELDDRRFNTWGAIGVQFSVSAAPLAICEFTYLVVGVGGAPYFFWCYLVAVLFQLCMVASLAEISAVFPHALGEFQRRTHCS